MIDIAESNSSADDEKGVSETQQLTGLVVSSISRMIPNKAQLISRRTEAFDERVPLLFEEENKNNTSRKHYHRYLVCLLILISISLTYYANATISIASIAMISSDVLQSSLTKLRASKPLAAGTHNVALPGTCPIEVTSTQQQVLDANQTLLTEHEFETLIKRESDELVASVKKRLSEGKLVNWTMEERSIVFAMPSTAGIMMALPTGYIALRFGTAKVISVAVISNALRLLLLPVIAVRTPYWATAMLQFLLGGLGETLAQISYPLGAIWLLSSEASAFVAMIPLASYAGSALSNLITSQMLSSGIEWQWCFYGPGECATLAKR